ncbi:hypothetical protein AKO1_009526 [Acrasis kona]|uniref:Uncharacterized protein n=1 Tax=Acrasis kona TaxID=1008807 RepID=A0AAW2ZMJ7_9EUKA
MTDVWNIREVRSYDGFKTDVAEHTRQFLSGQQFNLKNQSSNNLVEATKKGIHINFVPEISVLVGQGSDGKTAVTLHYYAKIAVATGLVTGFLTGGLSAIVGVGTFANHAADAKSFTNQFWDTLDGIAFAPGQITSPSSPTQFEPVPVPSPQEVPKLPDQDLSMLSTEQLEKLMQYHKDSAWKIESELMKRRNA